MFKSQRFAGLRATVRRLFTVFGLGALGTIAVACGPHAHTPTRPEPRSLPGAFGPGDPEAALARTLAPTLYLQRDETFPLSRVVAVVYAGRQVVAYHLLWRDDAYGAWLPFTVPTDEEVVWVGYDPVSRAPTDVWTYWHGRELHLPWTRLPVEINVQWGKHGSLPRGIRYSELPKSRSMNFFYAATIFGIPDLLLGRIERQGPICFCHSSKRYRDFSRVMPLTDRLDAVVGADQAGRALGLVFGVPYSNKRPLPLGLTHRSIAPATPAASADSAR